MEHTEDFDPLAEKRANAIAYLGTRWCMHPQYNSELYPHHRVTHKTSKVLADFNAARTVTVSVTRTKRKAK